MSLTVDESLRFADQQYTKQSFAGVLASEVRRLSAENAELRVQVAPAVPDESIVVGLLQLVEGFPPQDWRNQRGMRFKDTEAWCRFYCWAKSLQSEQPK